MPAEATTLVHSVDLGPGPFYGVYVVAEAEWALLVVEVSTDGEHWTSVGTLTPDSHAEQRPGRVVSNWIAAPSGTRHYRIRRRGGGVMQVHWHNPGATEQREVSSVPAGPSVCPCPAPEVRTRDTWCAGGCAPAGAPVTTDVTHLIVHHSAGTNSATDWAAVVRMIYELHVTGNGWDDVGYNYLIDPDGVIYTGRGNDIRGAHFCGSNTGTMGVCMLGTFTNETPTTAALSALARLLAWKSCDRDLDPLGSAYHASSELTLPHISGHRQGCATACPGDAFYPLLPTVRQETAAEIAACVAVATREGESVTGWRVYPNPTGDWLTLEAAAGKIMNPTSALVLFDARGLRVRTWNETQAGESLFLGDLPAGIYLLRSLATGEAVTVVKR